MTTPGPSFASRYVVPPTEGEVYDYLPESMTSRVGSLGSFAGILAFDKWTVMQVGGKQRLGSDEANENSLPASFTRDTVSMPASGAFRMRHCAV